MTKKQYIHLAIMILLTVLIGICPPFGAITQVGMRTIGVFVGVLYGWLTIDLIWPSLFGYAALAILGITDTTSALSSGFGNSQLVQVLVVMVMAGALDAIGVTKMLANWMVTRKIFRKSPWALSADLSLVHISSVSLALPSQGSCSSGVLSPRSLKKAISKRAIRSLPL